MSKMKKRIITILVLTLLLILFFGASVAIYGSNVFSREKIHTGVNVKGKDLSGMTIEEAKEFLYSEFQNKLKEKVITLKRGNYIKEVKLENLEINYNVEYAVNEAYKQGREGNFLERFKEINKLRKNNKKIKMDLQYKKIDIESILKNASKNINRDSVDATIVLSEEGFKTTDDKSGLEVDVEELRSMIMDEILNGDIENRTIEIPVRETKAARELSNLKKIQNEIGSYSTTFSLADQNRTYNIQLSSNSIDQKIIMPGEVFSFNNTTGPRIAENGYKGAKVIEGEEFVDGIGGGVCQTSSTLYNSVAQTDLTITERHNHSREVGYVPKGMDATVADKLLDFKFRNDFSYPVLLKSDVVGNTLIIKVFGK